MYRIVWRLRHSVLPCTRMEFLGLICKKETELVKHTFSTPGRVKVSELSFCFQDANIVKIMFNSS